MNKLYNILLILACSSLFISCTNDSDEIPAYIKIDSTIFNVKNSSQGSPSSSISDVWVYVNNTLVGAYEVPAFFPVLKSGQCSVIIRPGIKVNGIASTRMYYPFYSRDTFNVNLIPGEVTSFTGTLTPTFTYIPQTTFEWMEDFEDLQSDLVKTTRSNTIVNICSDSNVDPKYGGRACGQIVIQDSTTYFEVFNNEKLEDIPNLGSNVYLEMNYKTDAVMSVGIYAYYESSSNVVQTAVLRINPTTEWKKIYVYLTNTITAYYAADSYRIYFSGGDITADTISRKAFYIDNLKLVY